MDGIRGGIQSDYSGHGGGDLDQSKVVRYERVGTWRPKFLGGNMLFGKKIQLHVGKAKRAGQFAICELEDVPVRRDYGFSSLSIPVSMS